MVTICGWVLKTYPEIQIGLNNYHQTMLGYTMAMGNILDHTDEANHITVQFYLHICWLSGKMDLEFSQAMLQYKIVCT